jgi:hypothetical protein
MILTRRRWRVSVCIGRIVAAEVRKTEYFDLIVAWPGKDWFRKPFKSR